MQEDVNNRNELGSKEVRLENNLKLSAETEHVEKLKQANDQLLMKIEETYMKVSKSFCYYNKKKLH